MSPVRPTRIDTYTNFYTLNNQSMIHILSKILYGGLTG